MSNRYVGPLFRTQAAYTQEPRFTTIEGDVFGCTVRGTAVQVGWIHVDSDGYSYRRSHAIVWGDPACLYVRQPTAPLPPSALNPDHADVPSASSPPRSIQRDYRQLRSLAPR